MRADEFVSEGFWGSLFGKNRYEVAAKKSSAEQTQIVTGKWAAQLVNLKKSNPSMTMADLESALKSWADSYFKNSTRIPGPVLTSMNDQRSMNNYLSKRISEFLSTPRPAPGSSEMEVADEIPADGSKLQIKDQGVYTVIGGKWIDPTNKPVDDNVKTDKLSSLYAQSIKAKQDAAPKGAIDAPQVLSTIPNNVIFRYQGDDFYKNASGQWEGRKKKNKNLAPQFQEYFDDLEKKVAVPESKQHLSEGGNVFKNTDGTPATQRINRSDVVPTVRWLETVTGLSLTDNMLGSTGRNPTSGDLDLAVDPKFKETLVSKLQSWAADNKVDARNYIRKSGVSMHFRTPILGDADNGFVQTDFMFGDTDWMKFAMHGGEPNSKFKGLHRAILLSSIAKVYGLKWSPTLGLVSRETNQVISRDPDQIANYLLGDNATGDDLMSVERIMNKIRNQPNFQELIAQAKETLAAEKLDLVQ